MKMWDIGESCCYRRLMLDAKWCLGICSHRGTISFILPCLLSWGRLIRLSLDTELSVFMVCAHAEVNAGRR